MTFYSERQWRAKFSVNVLGLNQDYFSVKLEGFMMGKALEVGVLFERNTIREPEKRISKCISKGFLLKSDNCL